MALLLLERLDCNSDVGVHDIPICNSSGEDGKDLLLVVEDVGAGTFDGVMDGEDEGKGEGEEHFLLVVANVGAGNLDGVELPAVCAEPISSPLVYA